jgi:hypothetical protein
MPHVGCSIGTTADAINGQLTADDAVSCVVY